MIPRSEYKKLLSILAVLLLTGIVILVIPAQTLTQPSLPTDPTQTPIDGGLGILAALGGAYAVKKLREKEE